MSLRAHMWGNGHSPQVPHEVAGVVVLVCRHRESALPLPAPCQQLGAHLPFGGAGGRGEIGLDDEAVAVLGEQMTGIGQAGGCPGRVLGK